MFEDDGKRGRVDVGGQVERPNGVEAVDDEVGEGTSNPAPGGRHGFSALSRRRRTSFGWELRIVSAMRSAKRLKSPLFAAPMARSTSPSG